MGKGSSAPAKQTAIRDIPAEAKPFLYGKGDKYLTDIYGETKLDPETGEKMLNPDYIQGVLPAAQELFTMTPEQRTEAGMDYQIAGFSPMQQQAYSMAQSGIGAYKPYLDRGSRALGRGISTVQDAIGGTQQVAGQIPGEVRRGQEEIRSATSAAMPFQQEGLAAIRRGQEFLGGAAQGYDPRMAGAYYNPFEQQAVGAAMSDIARAGERQLSDIERQTTEQARKAGAFGGSRRFLEQYRLEQPVREDILQRQASTAAQMRQAGYGQAQQQAQNAFEQQQRRQMGVGQLFGQLGTQTGGLGTSFGQLGLAGAGQASQLGMQGLGMGLGAQQQMAGMGQGLGALGMQSAQMGGMAQQMAHSDINLLSQLGAQQQRQSQAQMDAARANAMAPYQQIGFMSDIIQGAPIGTAQTTFSPGASPFQQATGAAITMGSLQRAGIFG